MRSTPDKAPAFYLFLSSFLAILITADIFFIHKGIKSDYLAILSEIIPLFVLLFLLRKYLWVLIASILVISLHILNFYSFLSHEEDQSSSRMFRGKLVQIAEGYFGIKEMGIVFRYETIDPDLYKYAFIECEAIPLDLHNSFEKILYLKGFRKKCHKKINIVPAVIDEEGLTEGIRKKLLKLIPDTAEGSIIAGILTGDRSRIPPNIKSAFSFLGISHLLAVSGLHFGALTLFSFFIIGRTFSLFTGLTKRLNPYTIPSILTFPLMVLYWGITGGSPSATRAFIMTILWFISYLNMEKFSFPNIISFAGFIMLALKPTLAFDLSFQLSFSAIFFLAFYLENPIRIGNEENSFFKKILQYSLDLFFITAFCTFGTFPPIAHSFGYFSIMGFFSNLFFVPFYSFLVLPCGFIAASFSLLIPGLSSVLFFIPEILVRLSFLVVEFLLEKGPGLIFIPSIPGYYLSLYYSGFILVHLSGGGLLKYLSYALSIILIAVLFNLPHEYRGEWIQIDDKGNLLYGRAGDKNVLFVNFPYNEYISGREVVFGLAKKKLPPPSVLLLRGEERKKLRFLQSIMKFYKIEKVKNVDFNPPEFPLTKQTFR
jgi:ComEC/Rec2-related protein